MKGYIIVMSILSTAVNASTILASTNNSFIGYQPMPAITGTNNVCIGACPPSLFQMKCVWQKMGLNPNDFKSGEGFKEFTEPQIDVANNILNTSCKEVK